MKSIIKLIVVCFSLSWVLIVHAASNSPVGYWKTIDDVTGQPKSILQLWESSDHILYGKVVKIFPQPGHDPHPLCTACTGDKYNKPILGMVILEGLKQDGNDPSLWTGGSILEPKSGKVYHCTIQVVEGGEKLNVKGYVGISAFGRSQTWIREGNIH